MEPNALSLKARYETMQDDDLLQLANTEGSKLRSDAQLLLQEEINKRGLSSKLLATAFSVYPPDAIHGDEELKKKANEQFESVMNAVRMLPCPECGSQLQHLNGALVYNVRSFVFVTSYSKSIKVACPKCLDKLNNKATLRTLALGWWGFPWGIIRTPMALYKNYGQIKFHHMGEPNAYLLSFVQLNLHHLFQAFNEPELLLRIVKKGNTA
ncbi:MAG: hypothetical protein SFW35_12445 [Chitinophagales bacterium]|nr:hypothetical protein [Chitinophagales bacterium]